MNALKSVRKGFENAAFLIGNGPNLYAKIMPSWKKLLSKASDENINFDLEGLTNTEVYDLVEIHSENHKKIKERVCSKLKLNTNYNLDVHKRLMEYAIQTNSPVLTTNFDAAFETSVNAKNFHLNSKGFTRFYPWKSYYGKQQLNELPTEGFGIWKIQGDIRYKDSIRLGLTDYMGSAERARRLIHNGDDSLFEGKRQSLWKGYQTWLHIWFNMPMIIFGLRFGPDEIFLRWLIIERKRYFNLLNRSMDVWYISKGKPEPSVENLLKNLDVKFKIVNNYSEMYGK